MSCDNEPNPIDGAKRWRRAFRYNKCLASAHKKSKVSSAYCMIGEVIYFSVCKPIWYWQLEKILLISLVNYILQEIRSKQKRKEESGPPYVTTLLQ
jgi:hypothetical protein